uniref:Uncharacterized protein n=1 Tax=Anguilla anguilla TaxID=7936 RepID=A0A0E9W676_ANGAN
MTFLEADLFRLHCIRSGPAAYTKHGGFILARVIQHINNIFCFTAVSLL